MSDVQEISASQAKQGNKTGEKRQEDRGLLARLLDKVIKFLGKDLYEIEEEELEEQRGKLKRARKALGAEEAIKKIKEKKLRQLIKEEIQGL